MFDHLEALIGPYDREPVAERRRERFQEITRDLRPLPGVVELLTEAASERVPCAIASSSTADWVGGYLDRFGLADRFQHVVTRDMVALPKPAPDLYVEVCRRLGVAAPDALALEDSVNGVAAAKAAGLRCIAVPNRITAAFDLSRADHRVESMESIHLLQLNRLLSAEPI